LGFEKELLLVAILAALVGLSMAPFVLGQLEGEPAVGEKPHLLFLNGLGSQGEQVVLGEDYNVDGLTGIKEDEHSRLTVTPLSFDSPVNHYNQDFTLTNKSDQNRASVWIAYIFPSKLKQGTAEVWMPPVSDWVSHDFNCQGYFNINGEYFEFENWGYELNRFAGEKNPHFGWCGNGDVNAFEGEFYGGSLQDKELSYWSLEVVSGNKWKDVTDKFEHHEVAGDANRFAGKHVYYYADSFSIDAGETIEWSIDYKPKEHKGKWDLVIWTGDEWDCILKKECDYKLIFDPTWKQGGWTYRKKISIDDANVSSDLNAFPILVDFDDDSDLISHAMADGNDLRFTDDGGTTLLDFEKEEYSVNGADLNAFFWVKIPTVDADADTNIYIYYGNPSVGASDGQQAESVWDVNYAGVWHMDDTTTSSISDSTSNSVTGTKLSANNPIETSDAIVGNAQVFSSDYISNSAVTIAGVDRTFEVWVYNAGNTSYQGIFIQNSTLTNEGSNYICGLQFKFGVPNSVVATAGSDSAYYQGTSEGIAASDWHHVVGVIKGSDRLLLYVNGALVQDDDSLAFNPYVSEHFLLWGRIGDLYLTGTLDEVRVSSSERLAAWIKFEYANMASADNELTIAAEEELFVDVNVLDPNGGETITAAHDQNINFNVVQTEGLETRVALYYSDNAGDANVFIVDLNLDDQDNYTNLTCNGTDFNSYVDCTYDMNWHQEGVWTNDVNLIAYYPLDVDARDFGQVGDSGTITGDGVTTGVAGKRNRAMDFDGSDDFVTAVDSARWQENDKNVTACAWAYADDWTGDGPFPTIFQFGTSNAYRWEFLAWSGTMVFYVKVDGNDKLASVDYQPSTGAWHHYCGSYDGFNVRMYIDGILVDTTAAVGSMSDSATISFNIGTAVWAQSDFDGKIDEVMVWDTTLKDEDIRTLYNSYAADGNVNYVNDDDYFIDANAFDTSDVNVLDSSDASFEVDFVSDLSCGDTITENTTMTADLTGCTGDGIIIGASDIILNCADHLIESDGLAAIGEYGIQVGSYDRVRIENCDINGFYYGVYAYLGTDLNIWNSEIRNSVNDGIYLSSSSRASLQDCNVIYNGDYGIYSTSTHDLNVTKSFFSNNTDDAIRFNNNAHAFDNNITDNLDIGISISGNDGNFSNNNIVNNTSYGISISSSDVGNNFYNNFIKGNDQGSYGVLAQTNSISYFYDNNISGHSSDFESQDKNVWIFSISNNITNIGMSDTNSYVFVAWWLDVNVVDDSDDSTIGSANVKLTDTHGKIWYELTADAGGLTTTQYVFDYNQGSAGTQSYNEYDINANYVGYDANGLTTDIDQNVVIQIRLTASAEDDCTYTSGDWVIDDGSICIRRNAAQVDVDGDFNLFDGRLMLENSVVCATGNVIWYPPNQIDVNLGGAIRAGCTP